MLANAGFAKRARVGETIKPPKSAITHVGKSNAVGRNWGFRADAPEQDGTLPGLQKTVPVAGHACVIIDLHFETDCCARRIHGDIDKDSWGNRNLAGGIIGEPVGD